MQFNQEALKERLEFYLSNPQKTIIFTTDIEKPFLERLLLNKQEAFFHIQVVSVQNYLLDLLKQHQIFHVHLLSQAESLWATYQALQTEGLHYFAKMKIDGNLLKTLSATFEKMADLDLSQEVAFDELSFLKWQELKLLYQAFKKEKQKGYFEAELLQMVLPYLETDVRYVDFTHRPYSRSWALFLETCQAEILDEGEVEPVGNYQKQLDLNYHQLQVQPINDFPMDLYQTQFWSSERELILREISQALEKGHRYHELMVYFPQKELLESFVENCPYPCRYEPIPTFNQDLAFIEAWLAYLQAPSEETYLKAYRLSSLEEADFQAWAAHWPNEHQTLRLQALSQIVNPQVLSEAFALPEDVSLEAFILLLPLLVGQEVTQKNQGEDRIWVTTYLQPLLSKHFHQVFLCGLNEDVYPSKVSDGGLLLNSELKKYYPKQTPLDIQNDFEWALVKKILVSADHYVATCHFNGLDGTECLPSLLFNHLKQLKGIKKTKKYPLPMVHPEKDDKILARFEASHAQPQPLSSAFASQLYLKHGQKQASPSELENFNQCPFRHFVSYGLKVYPEQNGLETKRRFGTLMHDFLDACADLMHHDFLNRLTAKEKLYHLTPSSTLDERLFRLFEALLQENGFVAENAEEKFLYDLFPKQFLNNLKVLLHHIEKGEFDLAYHEYPISAKQEKITYVGRIDRADLYQDYLKILDYKSSHKKLELGLAMQGFNMQMLLYLELLAQKENLKKGAALYFNTSPRKLRSKGRMNLDPTSATDYLAEYQMEGYVLEEEKHEVMHAIDSDYPHSQIAMMRYVKSKDAYTGHLLTKSQWDYLLQNVFAHLQQLVTRCFEEGEIAIYPAGSKESALNMKVSPCRFCDYQSLCLRDPFYHEQREIQNYSQKEIAILLEGGKIDESSQSIE